MIREDAIKEAGRIVMDRLKNGLFTASKMIGYEIILADEHGSSVGELRFDPPRRIPPIGTPVKWKDSNEEEWSGISDGVNKYGHLVVKCPAFSTLITNWTELQEVPK